MGALFASGCAHTTSSLDSTPTSASPVAGDFCPVVVKFIDEFNTIAIEGYLNEDSEILDDLAFNAKKMYALAGLAEIQGVDLSAQDSIWLKNLRDSAGSFYFLLQDDRGKFSESELRIRLERIIGWYEVASRECRAVIA
jgi:hypothetical protein